MPRGNLGSYRRLWGHQEPAGQRVLSLLPGTLTLAEQDPPVLLAVCPEERHRAWARRGGGHGEGVLG